MRVIICGRHLEVTDAIKEYAREKVGRLERFHRGIDIVRITLDVEHGKSAAEAVATVRRATFVVHVLGDDMYAVIDKLVDKVQAQMKKHKEKIKDKKAARLLKQREIAVEEESS